MSTPTTQALATQDNTPRGMIATHQADFAQVMPTHIRPETWVRVAQGALKRGRKQGNRYELEIAAANNPGVFLASLLDAARLGLEPGTEEYYLTARKRGNQLEILGIVGYQGIIKLIYNAGFVSSVIAENVHESDVFVWSPGRLDDHEPPRWKGPQEVPYHEIDWDAEHRGPLRLVYSYARMKDGAVSKVVVLNKFDIKKIREASPSAHSEHSPWNKWPGAMWLKSAVRQLAKWVPTSTEIRNEAKKVESERLPPPDAFTAPALERVDPAIEGEVVDAEPMDAPASYYEDIPPANDGLFTPDPDA
jgi:recombination protein RecT